MSTKILHGLGRFVGLIEHNKPVNKEPDRLGYLIVNEEHFVHSYHHLGRRTLRNLIREYGFERYADVHPDALLAFLETIIGISPTSKSGERIRLLLETVIRILIFQRDKQNKVLSLYVLLEQMSLGHLAALVNANSIPKTLREALNVYLDTLPGFRDAMLFEEGIPVACYTYHQVNLKVIQTSTAVLDKRILSWLRKELDAAAELVKDPEKLLKAHRHAQFLVRINRSYQVMNEEDLIAQLLIRGFSDKLHSIIDSIGK